MQPGGFLAFMTFDITASGRGADEHLISIVFMSYCRDSDWLRESKGTWARRRQKDRARKKPAQHFQWPEHRKEERLVKLGGERKNRHTPHRLIASLSLFLSLSLIL